MLITFVALYLAVSIAAGLIAATRVHNARDYISAGETGFRGREDVLYRTEGWDFIIAGGGIYSSLDYSFTSLHPDGTLAGYKSPGGGSRELRLQLRILKDFIHGFNFVRMAPHNEVIGAGTVRASLSGAPAQAKVTARVLAEPGKAYAVYVLGGNAAELAVKLPAGKYQAEWIDTRTGKSAGAEQFEHAGGSETPDGPPIHGGHRAPDPRALSDHCGSEPVMRSEERWESGSTAGYK